MSLSNKLKERSSTRGIQKFGSLLIRELQEKFDVRIVEGRSDIHLGVIHEPRKAGSKTIVRIDGVYYDVKRLKMNDPIKKSLRNADGVIYQSKWAKVFVEGMLGVRARKSAIIYNGAKTSLYSSAEQNKYGFDEIVICCANWRVNKRLKSIVDSFLRCREMIDKNMGLFVVGEPDYRCSSLSVKFFGKVTDQIYSLYASSDYMCHICHLDACPNSVVEGLCAGIPVLCNNIGGTPELVGDDGIIAKLDSPFDFKPVPSMKAVSKVDINILTGEMVKLVSRKWDIKRADLDIFESASGYYNFFVSLLG